MNDNNDVPKIVFKWNKIFLSIGGNWPLEPAYFRFSIWMSFFTLNISLLYVDLYEVFGNLEEMLLNLSDSVIQSLILAKLLLFRFSKPLARLITDVQEDITAEDFESLEEKKCFLEYYQRGKIFYQITMPCVVFAVHVYFFKGLETYLFSVWNNEATTSFVLPYRTKLFFNLTSPNTYLLLYILEYPMVYIIACQGATICLLVTLIFHICGQLSIVSYKIQHLRGNLSEHDNQIIKSLIEKHVKYIRMARSLEDTFQFVLLLEVVGTTVILGLTCYNVIANSGDLADISALCCFVLYVSSMILLLYGYCFVGECLIHESTKIHEACAQCTWYNMPLIYQKSLIMCMLRAQRPLQLTAAKFYVFSLDSFSNVIKTSLAYVSMLRTVV